MMSKSNIWNKLIRIFCSLTLLWFAAPKHDCFCGNLSEKSVSVHETMPCCEKKAEASKSDCCSEPAVSSSNSKTGTELNAVSCCCAPERALLRDPRKNNTSNSLDLTAADLSNSNLIQGSVELPLISVRSIELQNDVLKSNKLFLLKCALLN